MKLEIPEGDFKAYLFDCDGTIVDSMPLHYVAWRRALGEQGCPFPGGALLRLGRHAGARHHLSAERGAWLDDAGGSHCARERAVLHRDDRGPESDPRGAGAIEDQHGKIPFAVVSGSTRDSVEASLSALGLLARFDALVCAGEYAKGKPDPEPFLTAARPAWSEAGRDPVFEDGGGGSTAAKAAGWRSVKVPLPHRAQSTAGNLSEAAGHLSRLDRPCSRYVR